MVRRNHRHARTRCHPARHHRRRAPDQRSAGQDRGAGMDQPRLPVRSEALRQRQHAAPAARGGDARSGVADRHLIGARRTGARDARAGRRPHRAPQRQPLGGDS